jgi:cytosine deaminase
MPPVKLLKEHGVEVFSGSDNIRDAWSPFGNGDMLERAMMVGYRANFRRDDELLLAFEMVTAAPARALGLTDYGLSVGGPADMVVVEAATIAEAVASRPRRKLVIKAGRVIARDGALVS